MLKRLHDHNPSSVRFDLLDFFEGPTFADGIFEDRAGRLKRRFTVDLLGTVSGNQLVLDEAFRFDDGSNERRVWTLVRGTEGRFAGTCADAVGPAVGHQDSASASMRSVLRLSVGNRRIAMKFDDVFHPLDERTVLNRSFLSKWGVRVGQVMILFRKPGPHSA